MTEAAPFFSDVTTAPDGGRTIWVRAPDGARLRVTLWGRVAGGGPAKGTVLLFPGRTEYVEKYGPAAVDLAARGYATATIDWRGQGLADRPLADPATGHVEYFIDYQQDVAALVAAVKDADLPRPYFLMAHSMGGCIGLRALHLGLPVRAAAFSGPMWGIKIQPALRPLAWMAGGFSRRFGRGHHYAPGTGPVTYVRAAPYADNLLTTDAAMFEMMRCQVTDHPGLALGGPSLQWLHEALLETRALGAMPVPKTPCYCALGGRERIVDTGAVRRMMARWPGAEFDVIPGAEHEVMMETPAIRARFYDRATALFDAQRTDIAA